MQLLWDQGTLLLHGAGPDTAPPGFRWDPRVGACRAPAYLHPELTPSFDDQALSLLPAPTRIPPPSLRPYQEAALASWELAGRRGLLVLPTGAGMTRTAIAALIRARVPTLILVPTRVLLEQWSLALQAAGIARAGRHGDGERTLGPVTVATFASAARHVPEIGNRFGMLVVDEVHHFGGRRGDEPLEMCAAPFRLGLTATPPGGTREGRLASLVGPIVYRVAIEDLAGEFLAPFRLVTLSLPLSPEERRAWEAERAVWTPVVHRFFQTTPEASWPDFVRAASQTDEGRRVLAAWRRARGLLRLTRAKDAILARLLARHARQRTLVFAPDAATAIELSRRHLIPAITADIGRAERARVLAAFAQGGLKVLASARVLNEGVDVPAAQVAIILGGGQGDRAYIQRVGRVLRPEEGKEAVIYELIVDGTAEARALTQRRRALATA